MASDKTAADYARDYAARHPGAREREVHDAVRAAGHDVSRQATSCALRRRPGAPARLITYDGQALTVRQWSERLGVPESTIRGRISRGLPVRVALTGAGTRRGRPRLPNRCAVCRGKDTKRYGNARIDLCDRHARARGWDPAREGA